MGGGVLGGDIENETGPHATEQQRAPTPPQDHMDEMEGLLRSELGDHSLDQMVRHT